MAEPIKFIPEQLWNDDFRFLKLRPRGKEPTGDSIGWQKNNYQYLDLEFQQHIANGGNYGVIGGYGNLILIDSDSEEINKIAENMPETFTVKTGNPQPYKKHYFYIADKPIKPIRLTADKLGDLGDVRSVGQYVVGAGSIHPSGEEYRVEKDIPITHITEAEIREIFKTYIEKDSATEFKEYPIDTKIRATPYIRECRMPDYLLNNKLPKGNTAKNWKLFRYIADILRNRQVNQAYYERIVRTQGHSDGAIKGWAVKANEGKLGKSSCKLMKEYIDKYYPELKKDICGNCPLNKTCQIKENIKANKDYTALQKEIYIAIAVKDRDKATELLVKEIKSNNFIYTTRDDVKSEMWIYKEGIYVPQGKSFVREFSREILGEAYSTQLSNAIISKIEADTFIEHDEFFNTNYIEEIPLINGILNIRTRELTEHTPQKIFFNKLPVTYNPDSDCPNVLNHFRSILSSDEDVKVMMELFGYLLLKEYKIEKAVMFVGFGRNGKSKTIELMKRFIGAENCASLPLRALHEESFSLSELFGKMANLAADLSKTDLQETGMIKSLIGRDTIQAKRKYLRDLNFVNYAKMIFAANELPKIFDTTDGFWTKWVLIEFPYKFVTKEQYDSASEEERKMWKIMDPDIIEKLTEEEELSGLLNYALDGLDRLLGNKDFSYTKSTSQVKDMWIRKSDSFTAFCYDHIEEDSNAIISKKDLRKYYHKYNKIHKLSGCSDKAIKITLESMFGVSESQNNSWDRIWEGINLKNLDKI
jgi:P4 family phage/plasmid primase-like protien